LFVRLFVCARFPSVGQSYSQSHKSFDTSDAQIKA
jgi:hypothetical protein